MDVSGRSRCSTALQLKRCIFLGVPLHHGSSCYHGHGSFGNSINHTKSCLGMSMRKLSEAAMSRRMKDVDGGSYQMPASPSKALSSTLGCLTPEKRKKTKTAPGSSGDATARRRYQGVCTAINIAAWGRRHAATSKCKGSFSNGSFAGDTVSGNAVCSAGRRNGYVRACRTRAKQI